jgi:hypothetical protein
MSSSNDAPQHKRLRPSNARPEALDADGLKLHLRVRRVGGRTLRVLTLRPGADAAFSVNHFHDTWHVVTDTAGACLFARLLWGLSYQREPGTVVVLHGEHLRPTPFDADPSPPVLLAPAHLTPPDHGAFRALKSLLSSPERLGPPDRTVRLHTFGFDAAEARHEEYHVSHGHQRWMEQFYGRYDIPRLAHSYRGAAARIWSKERMTECGGFLCYTAPPLILRRQAAMVAHLKPREEWSNYSDYHYLAEERARNAKWTAEGEVQVFRDYRRMVSEAAVARGEVLAAAGDAPAEPKQLREAVWDHKPAVERRRRQDRGEGVA